MATKLKAYVLNIRKITLKEAAKELNKTRPYFTDVSNGVLIPGRKFALEIEAWSQGWVKANDLLFPKNPDTAA